MRTRVRRRCHRRCLTGASILSAFLVLGLTALLPGGGGEGSAITYAGLTLAAMSSEAVCMAIGQILSVDAARTERAEGERVGRGGRHRHQSLERGRDDFRRRCRDKVMMMMPTTNDAAASASIASFATAWSTTPPSSMPPPTAGTTTTI